MAWWKETTNFCIIWRLNMASKVSSVFRAGLFNGKTAIVTGGATGIGCSIAQELLYLGNYQM